MQRRVEGEGVRGERAGWAVLDVYDSGPGISPDDLPRVFDRFFTTRAGRRGSGLGLALVKAITEAHGGTVSVRSTSGTCFTVCLP